MEMFADLAVPCLGVVENLTGLICRRCGSENALFGQGGGAGLAEQTGLPLLARLPFVPALAEASDRGCPPVVETPDSAQSARFHALAARVAEALRLDAVASAMPTRQTQEPDQETVHPAHPVQSERAGEQPGPIPIRTGTPQDRHDLNPQYAEPGESIAGVRDVLLVASGKGGVGKSTVTVNLACALRAQGLRVGVLDADLYGPSIARMLGTETALEYDAQGRAIPAIGHGIQTVSVAQRIPPEAALVWKGPLVAQTLLDMFRGVAWPDLDLLLVDLPPGTGDVPLTILEQIPVSGAILVTTPQRLAQVDAERGIELFHQLDIPVFGLVENMAHAICPGCGERQPLFPDADVAALARRRHVPYLGSLPLDPAGQALADTGQPLVEARPESAASLSVQQIAHQVRHALEQEGRARLRDADPNTQAAHAAFWERLMED
jgi:ATP-binding protein involved in chromosome partitioning